MVGTPAVIAYRAAVRKDHFAKTDIAKAALGESLPW